MKKILEAEILKDIMKNPEVIFTSGTYSELAASMGYEKSRPSGVLQRLHDDGLIKLVGKTHCKHERGAMLSAYKMEEGKEGEFERAINSCRNVSAKAKSDKPHPMTIGGGRLLITRNSSHRVRWIRLWLDGRNERPPHLPTERSPHMLLHQEHRGLFEFRERKAA